MRSYVSYFITFLYKCACVYKPTSLHICLHNMHHNIYCYTVHYTLIQVRVDSMMKVAEIEEAEKDKMRNKCKKIIDHGK